MDIDKIAQQHLTFLDNLHIKYAIALCLIFYVAVIAQRMPAIMLTICDNFVIKLVACMVVYFISKKDISIALLLVLCIFASGMAIHKYKLDHVMKYCCKHDLSEYNVAQLHALESIIKAC